MDAFLTELSKQLALIIGTALLGLIGVAITWLSAKVKQQFGAAAQDKANEYLGMLQHIADVTVVNLQQSVVDRLKKAGQWTPEAAAQVKGDAVRIAMESLGALRGQVEKQLLLDVPKYMESAIEVALHNLKQTPGGEPQAPPQN